ncbi:MAG: N-acetylmuramoyl-L-alanine amidase [Bacillota bacterium]
MYPARRRVVRWQPYVLVAVVTFVTLLAASGYERQHLAASARVLAGRTVLIDPGHGKPDPGASGPGGAVETDIVLAIGLQLRDLLESRGVTVVMTRTTDQDLADPGERSLSKRKRQDLDRRVQLANEVVPEAVLSIHANAFPSSQWYGAQVFYQAENPESQRLAVLLQQQLARTTGNTTRRASPRIDHCMLSRVTTTAVTVEVGFLSNPREAAMLLNPAYQQRVAWAIYAGLIRYFAEGALPTGATGIRLLR